MLLYLKEMGFVCSWISKLPDCLMDNWCQKDSQSIIQNYTMTLTTTEVERTV